jgi:hypothetical protein
MAQKILCAHTDQPVHAKGLCKLCYDKQRKSARRVQREIERPFAFKQQRQQDPAYELGPLNTYDLAVTDYVVRCMIKSAMDINKAIELICGDESPQYKGKVFDQLNTDVRIKTALQRDLTTRGLDDHSKDHFVSEVWRMFLNDSDPRLKAAAMRVLGKAFIADKIESKHIEDLPIADFTAGVKSLLGEAVDPDAPSIIDADCRAQHPEKEPK